MSGATDERLAVGDRAYRWLAMGASPVPVRDDGSKAPIKRWKEFIRFQPTYGPMHSMFGGQGKAWFVTAFGLVLRDGIECLETEDPDTEARFVAACDEAGLRPLLDRVTQGYADRGPSGGVHRIYRVTGSDHDGNTKLAKRREYSPKESEKQKEAGRKKREEGKRPTLTEDQGYDEHGTNQTATLVETRGLGGFIICAPSHGATLHKGKAARYATVTDHDAGIELVPAVPPAGIYEDISGAPETIAEITHAEREALCDAARTLDEMPERAPVQGGDRAAAQRASGATTAGDWFNEAIDWDYLMVDLLGWTPAGDGNYLRPGDTAAEKSATADYQGNGYLTVFSSSVEWAGDPKPGKAAPSYSKFSVLGLAMFEGDFTAAAKWVYDTFDVPKPDWGITAWRMPTIQEYMAGSDGVAVPAPEAPAPEPTSPCASNEEIDAWLASFTRFDRPKRLAWRVEQMRTEPHALSDHVVHLIEDTISGYIPAPKAAGAIRDALRHHGVTDLAVIRDFIAQALGATLLKVA